MLSDQSLIGTTFDHLAKFWATLRQQSNIFSHESGFWLCYINAALMKEFILYLRIIEMG